MKKVNSKYYQEIAINVTQLSQSLIKTELEELNTKEDKKKISIDLLAIISETYKCFKLLKREDLIDEYDNFLFNEKCLVDNHKNFLYSLVHCDKEITGSETYQNKIKDDNLRLINKIQIADYLKLKGDHTNACIKHLDLISQIDFTNQNLKHQFYYYFNYHPIKEFGIGYHDLISKPKIDIELMNKFQNYELHHLFYSLHSSDEKFTTLMDQKQLEGLYSEAWITDAFRRKLDFKIIDYIQNINSDPPDIFWLSNQNSDSKHLKYLEKYIISDLTQINELHHDEVHFQIGCAVLTENYNLANKISEKIYKIYQGDYHDHIYGSCLTWGLQDQAEMWSKSCNSLDFYHTHNTAMNNLAYQGRELEDLFTSGELEPNKITYEWFNNKKLGGFSILHDIEYALKSFKCSDFDKLIINKYKISEIINN